MASKAADHHRVSALASLIERVITQEAANGNDLSYAKIAERGGVQDISRGNVRSYATRKQRRLLDLEKREALALGLRLHRREVDRAMAEDLDLWLDDLPYDYRTDPELTREDRDQIESYIQAIKDSKRRGKRRA